MNVSELKLKIFREIDSLEKSRLQEVYGYLQNLIRGGQDLDEWNALSSQQQQGILEAIKELNDGKGVVHEDVISKYRKKFSDA